MGYNGNNRKLSSAYRTKASTRRGINILAKTTKGIIGLGILAAESLPDAESQKNEDTNTKDEGLSVGVRILLMVIYLGLMLWLLG